MTEKGLVSSMEVGLTAASGSAMFFGEESLGEVKREAATGDGREGMSDIMPCLLPTALDLFLSIIS